MTMTYEKKNVVANAVANKTRKTDKAKAKPQLAFDIVEE
jgi:hypothetical protein